VTSQEEQMLNSLVERVNATHLTDKDPDAAALLSRGLSANPDALYVLAQSVLVQNIALEQARAQLSEAQQKLKDQPAHSGSFLGGLLGHRDSAPHPQAQPVVQQVQQPAQTQYQPVYQPQVQPEYQAPYQGAPYQGAPYPPAGYAPGGPAYGGPGYGGPGYGGPGYGPPPGQPSFLRSAAQTAAGVAAGALAFEGVEALLHGGFGHPGMGMGMGGWCMPGVGFGMGPGMGMGGMGMGMGGFERPVEETVVNNYYDSPGGGEHLDHERGGGDFRESASDGDGRLSDASWDDDSSSVQDDGGNFDDSGSGFDDSGSGSGFDDGGNSGGGGDLL
jgi:uncharacterized protein